MRIVGCHDRQSCSSSSNSDKSCTETAALSATITAYRGGRPRDLAPEQRPLLLVRTLLGRVGGGCARVARDVNISVRVVRYLHQGRQQPPSAPTSTRARSLASKPPRVASHCSASLTKREIQRDTAATKVITSTAAAESVIAAGTRAGIPQKLRHRDVAELIGDLKR